MFSAVWLQSSFSMTSWFVGTRAMRSRERERVLEERGVGHDLEDQAELGRLPRRDLVAGQQVALRPLEPHAVDPHRRRRRAPDARRRIAERRALARDDMSAQSTMSVPPPMHQPCTAAIVGFCAYQSFM